MLSKVGSFLAGGLTTFITTMVQGLSNINFDAVVGALGAAGFGAIVKSIIKFVKNLSGPFESLYEIAESVVGVLDSVKDSLKADKSDKCKDTINHCNSCRYTCSVVTGVIGDWMVMKTLMSLGALTVMFAQLLGALFLFENRSASKG